MSHARGKGNMWASTAILAVLGSLAAPVLADVYDGFEDGNWTSNPTWLDANPGYGQDGGIVPDPIRPSNLVWKAKGAEQAGHGIVTTDFTPMPWTGFHCSTEFLTTTSFRFGGMLDVKDEDWFASAEEEFRVKLLHDVTHGNQACLVMGEANPSEPFYVSHETWFDLGLIPTNEWLRLSLWHEPASGLVRSDVRRVSDGTLIIEASMTPVVFGGASPLTCFSISVEELEWQYMDNAALIPEPASLSLALLGVAGLRKLSR